MEQRLPTVAKGVPAFLLKLYNMVSEESSNDLIRFSEDVTKPEDFAKEVLPRFFKHNNTSSFVRQLNMYGFHKVPHLQQADELTESWEFYNENFKRNRPDLLVNVRRKSGKEADEIATMDLKSVFNELSMIKNQQISIANELKNLHRDNRVIWEETIAARERHQKQQEIIDKILRFLASVFAQDLNGAASLTTKRKRLMIEDNLISQDDIQSKMMQLMDPIIQIPSSSDSTAIIPNMGQTQLVRQFSNNLKQTTQDANVVLEDIEILQENLDSLSESLGITEANDIFSNPPLKISEDNQNYDEFDINSFIKDDD